MNEPMLTPCIVCEKAVMYLWRDNLAGLSAENLDGGVYMSMVAGYGSVFDMNEYQAIICDDCLDKAVQRNRVIFVKEHSFGNSTDPNI
jgi:hypothetical protein